MKKLIVTLGAAALLAIPATASAADGSGNAYGKSIQECFGMTYGQAKNAAWDSGHADKPALGAKDTALAHAALC